MRPVLVETMGSSWPMKAPVAVSLAPGWGRFESQRDHSDPRSATRGSLSYPVLVSQIQMFHIHSSRGTGYEVIRTGVVSSGVVMGVQELFNFTPLPKSKSQIFTGDTCKRRQDLS